MMALPSLSSLIASRRAPVVRRAPALHPRIARLSPALTLTLLLALPAAARAGGGPTEAELAQHVRALRAKLPAHFSIVVTRPFVVIGDGGEAEVRRAAKGTVAWSVDRLRAAYFDNDPSEIVDIYLFRDDASYRKHAKSLFDDEPDTPYGYYSETHHALIMNISTGGGTLVHEIVHPFMRANFPRVPAWFNEGLASLYEQSGEQDGAIRGYTNWRLAGLQQAIRARTLPSFRALTALRDHDFYEGERGDNYAQARYLCYYLQERGLLGRFYREFLAHHRDDPTGYATLTRVLGERDMDDFQRRWERYVLSLQFR